ncbi:unnamed protein product [Coffea canephora]|uniref:DH200=94 genomic scaffold, scaffold_1298 n=1 Tax=Coffea canephora TaxID=49390 RepID=A0A068VI48_COFCA|nr:unnamed protein product [Coffea canephora]
MQKHLQALGPSLLRTRSAIGLVAFTVLLTSWALTFAIGVEHLFGHAWDQLVMYNLADRYGLTGWI